MSSSSFSSSSSTTTSGRNNNNNNNYDVFISFRGPDTRAGFTGYLANALRAKNIKTFTDDIELEKGQVINSALENAIQYSRSALLVFSENYASSRYCLQELALIMKCRAEKGTFVWPIFYRLDPADVGFQRKSFGEAFEKHEQRYDEETIQEWKSALKEASKISGWHIPYGTVEITVVNDIVQSVSTKLSKLCEDDSISNIREAMKMPVGILYVKVLRATRLKKKDLMGAPDPYVILKLTDDECHAIKTAVKYKNLNPEWNEQFSLAIKDPKSQALELSIYDWKQFIKHDKMGMNVIPLKELTPDEPKELTLDLLKTMDPNDPENMKYHGDLTVEVLYKPEDSSAIEKAPEGTPGSGGVLEVTIHEAEYVEGKHHTNPYARLIFKGLEGRTKQVMKNRCPRWEQSFQFVLDEPPTNERLLIEVESASSKMGLLHPKENLGYVLINLADVVSNKRINEKYNLIDSRRGRIQVELLWITPY